MASYPQLKKYTWVVIWITTGYTQEKGVVIHNQMTFKSIKSASSTGDRG
jgi:hypothetical protein